MGIFKHFGQSGMGYPVKVEKTGTGLWKSDSVSEIVFLERLREHNLIKVNLIPILTQWISSLLMIVLFAGCSPTEKSVKAI